MSPIPSAPPQPIPTVFASIPAWIEVDLGALVRNAERLVARSGKPLIAVVKADAYGHGATEVVRALRDWSNGRPDRMHAVATATLEEALSLRALHDARSLRILCVSPLLPAELERAHQAAIMPALHHAETIHRWSALDGGAWHLSIDTGMQRAGVRWDQAGALRDLLAAHPPAGVFTHFHSAEQRDGSRELQDARFAEACAALGFDQQGTDVVRHTDNSAAIAARGASDAAYVRPGLALYGGGRSADLPVEPVAAVRARIVDLHDLNDGDSVSYGATWRASGTRRIATLAIGHGDGYRQAFSNKSTVLLHGTRVPVAGVVSMDMTMIDVTHCPCTIGDVVTLVGRDGSETVHPDDLATVGNLSVYELFIGLRLRLPRIAIPSLSSSPGEHP